MKGTTGPRRSERVLHGERRGFLFNEHPIAVKVGEPLRILLVNMTEFDLINSSTSRKLFHYTDRVQPRTARLYRPRFTLGQGERGIMEFSFKTPGRYMFHATSPNSRELVGWAYSKQARPQEIST